jgi:hypothetical protein
MDKNTCGAPFVAWWIAINHFVCGATHMVFAMLDEISAQFGVVLCITFYHKK